MGNNLTILPSNQRKVPQYQEPSIFTGSFISIKMNEMKSLVVGSILCFTFLVHSQSYAGPGRVLKGIVKAPVKVVEYTGKGIGEGVEHTGKAVGEGVEHIVKVPYYVGEGVVKGVKAPFDNN